MTHNQGQDWLTLHNVGVDKGLEDTVNKGFELAAWAIGAGLTAVEYVHERVMTLDQRAMRTHPQDGSPGFTTYKSNFDTVAAVVVSGVGRVGDALSLVRGRSRELGRKVLVVFGEDEGE